MFLVDATPIKIIAFQVFFCEGFYKGWFLVRCLQAISAIMVYLGSCKSDRITDWYPSSLASGILVTKIISKLEATWYTIIDSHRYHNPPFLIPILLLQLLQKSDVHQVMTCIHHCFPISNNNGSHTVDSTAPLWWQCCDVLQERSVPLHPCHQAFCISYHQGEEQWSTSA